MGWLITVDLAEFRASADGYLRTHAAENIELLSAVAGALDAGPGCGGDMLYGWWEPAEGADPRGAFVHDPAEPLLIAGQAPENAAALAAPLARAERQISAVEAPAQAADAFAAAWGRRAGVGARVQRRTQVYRFAGLVEHPQGPPGQARPATWADRPLLVDWLRACAAEVGDLAGVPEASADELLRYSGAAFWEVEGEPVAVAVVTRPVSEIVRLSIVYTPPEYRGHGYAAGVMIAASRAALVGRAREVVVITDRARPLRRTGRLGYELIGERALLSFGPATRPIPRVTGQLPRLR